MTNLDSLYQEVLLDHYRKPRNKGVLEGATAQADGRNPLCGDEVNVAVTMEGDRVAAVKFTGQGCSISQASASVMTQLVDGKSEAEIEALFERFHGLVTGTAPLAEGEAKQLGAMAAFAGVSKYPTRVKCATMSWHTLRKAMGHE
ncbi:MAG: SUF system NifU family Fe-S cluster assembly protein [Gemmatimonadetes bacterium]|nr:SUF system NifU family Fe-S cluster assembly protein [Gemmatimonadota bacterium]